MSYTGFHANWHRVQSLTQARRWTGVVQKGPFFFTSKSSPKMADVMRRYISVLWRFGPYSGYGLPWGFETIQVTRGSVVSPTPNSQQPWRTGFSLPTYLAWEALPVATLPPAKLDGSFDHTSPATICRVLQPLGADAKSSHVAFGRNLITPNGLYDMHINASTPVNKVVFCSLKTKTVPQLE